MSSPARRHMQIALAQQANATSQRPGPSGFSEGSQAAHEYRMLLIALGEDLRQLQSIQSVERKIEVKREMIERYRDWLTGAQQRKEAVQDDIVFHTMVWAMDISDWPLALDLATLVLEHGMVSAKPFSRTPATLIAEQAANNALGSTPTIDLTSLQYIADLTEGEDMPDQVRAKLHKAIGLAFKARVDAFDPEAESAPAGGKGALIAAATAELERALQLDATCGVKTLIAQLSRAAKALAEEKTSDQSA